MRFFDLNDPRPIEVGELHALSSHSVQSWRSYVRGPKAADVRIALIVGKDDDKVRL